MGKKLAATAASKISSSSALTNTPSNLTTSNSSAVLKSSFAPTHLQLRLFASVIQSFESQSLRIHDISTGHLRQQHATPADTNVTCIDWGHYGPSYREHRNSNKRKRKRVHDNQEDVVVAYGTSSSEICMYSPAQGRVVGTLRAGHEREVKDFKFLPSDNLQAWSVGADSKLVQWSLDTDRPVRSISLTDSSIQSLCSPSNTSPQILCASVTPYAVHIESKDDFRIDAYDAFKSPVHTLMQSTPTIDNSQQTFLAADHDRYVNLYSILEKKILRTLVVSGNIQRMSLVQSNMSGKSTLQPQVLAVVTRDGVVDLFSNPFSVPQHVNGDMKAKRKGLTRKADASVKLVNEDKSRTPFPAFDVCFDGPNLVIASIDAGIEPVFQKVRWQDEGSGDLLFEGTKTISRARSAASLSTATLNGAKDMGNVHVNEAQAVVLNGTTENGSQAAPLEIESDSENQEEDVDAEEDDVASEPGSTEGSDEEMGDADEKPDTTTPGDGAKDAEEEPSFGDLLALRHPEAISVMDTLPADQQALTTLPETKQALLPSGLSLGTVLTQSLKTNDQSLLETCLHVTDEHVIQNTLLRLESSLAANLLTKLAERLANRPGRYGHLLTWVQLTMIAHGGSIASQAGVAAKLRTLYQVLNERSKILPSILLLKGKLDMMAAQQSFRAQAEEHRKGVEGAGTTLYIEGQEDNWSSDEDLDEAPSHRTSKTSKSRVKRDLNDLIGGPESSDDDEGMPLVNGDFHTDEEESGVSDDDARPVKYLANGIVDDEAEVSGEEDAESGSDGEENEEDDEEEDDEEDSSMDDFIDDGEISEVDDADDIDIDEDEPPSPPAKKKSKHK